MTAAQRQHHMTAMRDLYRGEFKPTVAEIREPLRIVSIRRSGDTVLLAISENNVVSYWRVTAADDPRLQALGSDDRNQVQALAIAIKREVTNG